MADIFALEDASKRISTTNQASFSFTFTDAGTYTVYIQLQGERQPSGQCSTVLYTTTRTVLANSPAQLGTTIANTYMGMLNQLTQNKPDKAVKYFTEGMQDIYTNIFSQLNGDLPQIAEQISNIVNGVINENTAELMIVIDVSGNKQITPVHLLRGDDGVWRISGM